MSVLQKWRNDNLKISTAIQFSATSVRQDWTCNVLRKKHFDVFFSHVGHSRSSRPRLSKMFLNLNFAPFRIWNSSIKYMIHPDKFSLYKNKSKTKIEYCWHICNGASHYRLLKLNRLILIPSIFHWCWGNNT